MLVPTAGIEFKAAGGGTADLSGDAGDGVQDAEDPGFALLMAALNQPVLLGSAPPGAAVDARTQGIPAGGPGGRILPMDGKLLPLPEGLPALVQGADDEGLLPQLSLLATAARLAGHTGGDPLASVFGQQLLRPEVRTPDVGLAGLAGFSLRGSAPAVATSSVPSGAALSPQQPGFDQALSQRVLMFVQQGNQDARVRVHPEHLGPIEIRIRMESDGLQVSMASPHAAVREALESALPRLRETLADHGLDLGHAEVGSGEREADRQRSDSAGEPVAGEETDSAADTDADARRSTQPANGYALIDTFA